jgi:hypothetical protein
VKFPEPNSGLVQLAVRHATSCRGGTVGIILALWCLANVPAVHHALTKEANMSIGAKVAVSVAIALSIAATAEAAPRQQKNAAYRSAPRAQPTAQRTVPFANPYSPEATGGGSIGYNNSVLIQR